MPIPSPRELGALSLAELDEVAANIVAAREAIMQRTRQDAAREIEGIARKYNLPLDQLLAQIKGYEAGEKAPVRYVNPADPEQSWSGMGRKPKWLTELLAQGATLGSLEG